MADFMADGDFELFRSLIYDESGIHFSATNRSILESRLKERLREKKLEHVRAYYDLIKSDKHELNQAHFDALEHYVLPALRTEKAGEQKLRIWSAGCSTGEEPYTIAMLMKELLPPSWKAEIIASDLSLKSLMVGKEGFYADAKITGIPPQYLTKYFDKVQGGYRVHDDIKQMIRFDYHNLKNDSGLKNLDIVFCRNVLIYFDEAAQKAAVERFWDAMSPRSFLFIGHSESLFGMNTKFEFLKTDWACFYRKHV